MPLGNFRGAFLMPRRREAAVLFWRSAAPRYTRLRCDRWCVLEESEPWFVDPPCCDVLSVDGCSCCRVVVESELGSSTSSHGCSSSNGQVSPVFLGCPHWPSVDDALHMSNRSAVVDTDASLPISPASTYESTSLRVSLTSPAVS